MRMVVIKERTDRQALGTLLLGNAARKESALLRLQRLNPHVDFKRLEPGTVLLVPEDVGLKRGEGAPVSGEPFDAFRSQVAGAVKAAGASVRQGYDTLAAQRAEFSAVLRLAAMKRLLESSPDFKPQLDAAARVFKKDQEQAKEAETALKTLQEGSLAQLDALAKRL